MASQTQGIQQLLAAEKKAAEKVIIHSHDCDVWVNLDSRFERIMISSRLVIYVFSDPKIYCYFGWKQVQEARKRKARRLKQAKEEATVEIERFKSEKERLFREKEQTHVGSRDDVAARIDSETKVRIESMNKSVAATKDKVITELLDRVIGGINPELHRNLRLG